MTLRGIRGAITVEADRQEDILQATAELLIAIQRANPSLDPADLASVFFTTTPDISSIHPARAARDLGWTLVPMMCAREIPVPGSLPLCIRVLLHWNTPLPQEQINHIYLRGAASLRPDLLAPPTRG
jgi:chorismate mutase